jgi:hypothetical protein
MAALADTMVDFKAQIGELETRLKTAKEELAEQASVYRTTLAEKDDYIGMIRITGKQAPVRVEFRTNKSKAALDLDQAPVLDELYGASRMLLWEKDMVITGVTDPAQLIIDLQKAGLNPYEYLNVSVKPGMERIVADKSKVVVVFEAFTPVKGCLNTVRDIIHTWSTAAKAYFRAYTAQALEPYITTGTATKKGA